MTRDKDTANRIYTAAYCAHQIATDKYRARKIGDTEFMASVDALNTARKDYETFLFGGTDNECNY